MRYSRCYWVALSLSFRLNSIRRNVNVHNSLGSPGKVGEDYKNKNLYYDQGIIKRGEKRFPAGENLFWDLIGQCRMLEADC